MPKVSVILPCYNVAPYVGACLDSLVNQTLRDIEIICVDDKSTDDTANIIKKRAGADARIKLIELPKNAGVSVARNTGIDAANGEYIGFVDPDDYVDLDFYEKLYETAKKTNTDITVGNIRECMLDGKNKKFTYWLKQVEHNKYHFNRWLWCAIYKKDFLINNKIYCPVGISMTEDTVFVTKCAVLAEGISVVYDTYYNYMRVQNSAASVYLSSTKIKHIIEASLMIVDFLNNQDIPERDYNRLFRKPFGFVSYGAYWRTTRCDDRMNLAHATQEMYNRHKYKHIFANHALYPFFYNNDYNGIFEYVSKLAEKPEKIEIKLFNAITILRLKQFEHKTRIYVLGIPILTIGWTKRGVYNG